MEERNSRTAPLFNYRIFFEDFLKYFRRLFYVPVVLALALSLVFCVHAYKRYSPMYEAYATFTVQLSGDYGTVSPYYSKATAEQMEKTFPAILNSGILIDTVKNDLGVSALPASIQVNAGKASLFTISCTAKEPKDAYDVLQATIRKYPAIAQYVVGDTSLVLVDESGIPKEPCNSVSYTGHIKKGIVAGVSAGLLFIILLALSRNTVRSVEDIHRILNVHCIATLPEIRIKRRSNDKIEKHVLAFKPNIPRNYTDAVRLMGVRAEAALRHKGNKALLITSAVPGEGKTSVSSGLALALSKQGKRVALIDCDLRNPSVLARFRKTEECKKTLGISDYLRGQADMEDIFVPVEHDLYVVHAGKPVQNASEVLDSAYIRKLIKKAKQDFDVVILDTPPTYLLSDALSVAKAADAVLFVIKRNYARANSVSEAVERIAETKLHLLGCVLNA